MTNLLFITVLTVPFTLKLLLCIYDKRFVQLKVILFFMFLTDLHTEYYLYMF